MECTKWLVSNSEELIRLVYADSRETTLRHEHEEPKRGDAARAVPAPAKCRYSLADLPVCWVGGDMIAERIRSSKSRWCRCDCMFGHLQN
jgi:hypothetical protein